MFFEKNEPQDIVTVSNRLKDQNNLEAAGGLPYLATLTSIAAFSESKTGNSRDRDLAVVAKTR